MTISKIAPCLWFKDEAEEAARFYVSADHAERAAEDAGDRDQAKAQRVMTAMMGMVKLDIAGLQRAYDGG